MLGVFAVKPFQLYPTAVLLLPEMHCLCGHVRVRALGQTILLFENCSLVHSNRVPCCSDLLWLTQITIISEASNGEIGRCVV